MNQNAKRRAQRGYSEEAAEAAAPSTAPLQTPQAGERAWTVEAGEAGARLDQFLARKAKEAGEALSRTRFQALAAEGAVRVEGAVARDAGLRLREGQRIVVSVPEPTAAEPAGEAIPLDVVFEDAHLIVIDKPAGLVVHPAAGHDSGTLVNALIAHCGASLSGVGGVRRPGIVHRLDKDTSGLLVVAKSDAAHQGLAALFADHGRTLHLEREYRALVWGAPARSRGVVDAPVGRHATHREKQAIVHGARGREAITHYETLDVFADAQGTPVASLIACRLETGRTHQIRVHMAHLGHPVMGDALYGAGFRTKASRLSAPARAALDALGRQALHAAALGFEHPLTGDTLSFASDPPADMARLMAALRAE